MTNEERIQQLKDKMGVASTIYRRLRNEFPKLEQWTAKDDDTFSSWRQVWQMVVSYVMKGLWTLKTRLLRRPEVVFAE